MQTSKPPTMKLLLSQAMIAERVRLLGNQITAYYRELGVDDLVLVPIMDGAMVFCADLMRNFWIPNLEVMPVTAKSYQGTTNTNVRIGSLPDVRGRHVLLVDDVLDTGNTLKKIAIQLEFQNIKSLQLCVFLDKEKCGWPASFHAFKGFADSFVLGYGLDLNGKYRQLPDLVEIVNE